MPKQIVRKKPKKVTKRKSKKVTKRKPKKVTKRKPKKVIRRKRRRRKRRFGASLVTDDPEYVDPVISELLKRSTTRGLEKQDDGKFKPFIPSLDTNKEIPR